MDGNRFDDLTRALGSGRSRRSVFKALGAAALGAIGIERLGASASAGGGNSDCAQWCHANFSGSDAGHCTSDAAHGTGACYGCGPAAPAGSTAQLCGGVCLDTTHNVNDCGACGKVCTTSVTNATATCSGGACGFTCNANFTLCNGACVNELTDVNNCGTCGNACSTPNGTAVCTNGACGVGACNAGFADCDQQPGDGCEINIATDPGNCGACGRACFTINGSPECVNGVCAVGTCDQGFADCNQQPGDGCEVNIQTDPTNCGVCGHVCFTANGISACVNGVCTVAACNQDYANCDALASDGCETNIATDPSNCGDCGVICIPPANGVPTCSGGACGFTCAGGLSPCGFACVDQTSDANNCGACGHVCQAADDCTPVSCASGTCNAASICTGGNVCDAGTQTCIAPCPTPPDSSYQNTCNTIDQTCANGHTTITATCQRRDQVSYLRTSIDVNSCAYIDFHVANCDGTLTCGYVC